MTVMRYAEALNTALREEMQRDPSVFLFGEDIGRYGGVFKVSRVCETNLAMRASATRRFPSRR